MRDRKAMQATKIQPSSCGDPFVLNRTKLVKICPKATCSHKINRIVDYF